MAIIIERLTVAQASTVINAIIIVAKHSLILTIVALLLHFTPAYDSANTWSVAGRVIHSSLWPTLLVSDSASASNASLRVNFFSKLTLVSAVLVVLSGIITPLGLKSGPVVVGGFGSVEAAPVSDTSPLGLATSPRGDFKFGRVCGETYQRVPCPSTNPNNPNSTDIPPATLEKFSSTPYGPFTMQFRRYFSGVGPHNLSMTLPDAGIIQSFIFRDDTFAIDGLVVDMSDKPGIGILNHTIPSPIRGEGATWLQDVLWLEPVTACVNTNITLGFRINFIRQPDPRFITDHGGFVNLTREYPRINHHGQNIDLHEHAYLGAVLSNLLAMEAANNMTRNESYIGRNFPLKQSTFSFSSGFEPGYLQTLDLVYLSGVRELDASRTLNTLCQGYGTGDSANITNVGVNCGVVTSPGRRMDGGDERTPSVNSTWQQTFHVCASATRASIQKITFTVDKNRENGGIQVVSRELVDKPILWAVEKTNMDIKDVSLLWGPVADQYESDPLFSTTRSSRFYLPAGETHFRFGSAWLPSSLPGAVWADMYAPSGEVLLPGESQFVNNDIYAGKSSYSLLTKWKNLTDQDPETGHAHIRNLIWTDIMANNLIGTARYDSLVAAVNRPSVTFDLKYGIPLFLLILLWLPSFLSSIIVLLFGLLKFSHIRNVINHTSVGRLALGQSALVPADRGDMGSIHVHMDEKSWAKTCGTTPLVFRPIVNDNDTTILLRCPDHR